MTDSSKIDDRHYANWSEKSLQLERARLNDQARQISAQIGSIKAELMLRSIIRKCEGCENSATIEYDLSYYCADCHKEVAQRDLEEMDDCSNMMGG